MGITIEECKARKKYVYELPDEDCVVEFYPGSQHVEAKTVKVKKRQKYGGEVSKLAKNSRQPVRPIQSQVCAWCEKDEMYVPMQDCVGCQHSRQDEMTVWCSWAPAEKPCEGCGIPAEYCEPNTCMILQAIKKSDPRGR